MLSNDTREKIRLKIWLLSVASDFIRVGTFHDHLTVIIKELDTMFKNESLNNFWQYFVSCFFPNLN